jgi:head-tail adaptor
MRAGDFRDLARFERHPSEQAGDGEATDAYGNPIGEWAEIASVSANLRETPGRESVKAGRLESSRTGTLRVRASTIARGIKPADRVHVRGALWNILSGPVQVDNAGMIIEFLIETGGSQ